MSEFAFEDLDVREFPLGTVLTVMDADARLFSPDGLDGVQDMLSYLVGETIYSNQLPRIIKEVRAEITRQHPFLQDDPNMQPPQSFEKESIRDWLGWLSYYAGDSLSLLPLRPEDHTSIDPRDEWAMRKGTDKNIFTLEVDDPEDQ